MNHVQQMLVDLITCNISTLGDDRLMDITGRIMRDPVLRSATGEPGGNFISFNNAYHYFESNRRITPQQAAGLKNILLKTYIRNLLNVGIAGNHIK